LRHLIIILGDQLNETAEIFDNFDASKDIIWMAEVLEESTHVPSSKQRITLFLSAMRHFAKKLSDKGWPIDYHAIDDHETSETLSGELSKALDRYQPEKLKMTAPGDYRVLKMIDSIAQAKAIPLEILDDTHFFTTIRDFKAHAKGRKNLLMEFWYRELRKKFSILMDKNKPMGGRWNFDSDNRQSFGKKGPDTIPSPSKFMPDEITQRVITIVNKKFKDHPGHLDHFYWPVTRQEALHSLKTFISERLPLFGHYEDAMWTDQAWLYHSHLSSSLNLKLINPREVIKEAELSYHKGHAPLASVEGFIRQILGWREYVRGLYWSHMPDYLTLNALNAEEDLPEFYWTGETDYHCLKETITQTLKLGYAHHIQRLMVLGLYTLLRGVKPQSVHEWFLSVYCDAVEWVELPNSLGMSQYGDGGIMASKPYIASGKYIQRMSNYCSHCSYDPSIAVGEKACPFTTLYWDFLSRHQSLLEKNPRMGMQLKNLARLTPDAIKAIKDQAQRHRDQNE
jgi:deoxyribodipyrimidine photolyase-related protein